MIDLEELKTKGWSLVHGISSQDDLIELGKALGTPVRAPNGELVKEIRRLPAEQAPLGSQSSIYGSGAFPLHTDTVFWSLPVRYVLLRGYGDPRRPTTVKNYNALVSGLDREFHVLAQRSIWIMRAGQNKFYCSLIFRVGDSCGIRCDLDLMSPVNNAAFQVEKQLRPLVKGENVESITWSGDFAVVLSNWNTLHGRGPEPQDEGLRVVERLYVR